MHATPGTPFRKDFLFYSLLAVCLLVLVAGNLMYGAVRIPFSAVWDVLAGRETERTAWQQIILQSRLPQTFTALFAGVGLC